MSVFKSIVRELLALFVDDYFYAVSIFAWLALAAIVLPLFDISARLATACLLGGLLLILVESTTRFARKGRTR
jgi:hypothetical protein